MLQILLSQIMLAKHLPLQFNQLANSRTPTTSLDCGHFVAMDDWVMEDRKKVDWRRCVEIEFSITEL